MKSLRREQLIGPVLTAAVLVAFVILDATVVRIQNPAPIFLIAVTFAGYVGGLGPALVSAIFAIAFSAYFFSVPGDLLTYTPADQARLASVTLGSLTIAALTGVLRGRLVRAERAGAREREARIAADVGASERGRLQMILDQLPEGVVISDEHGTFTLRNQAAERLFPWPDRELDTALRGAEYLQPDGTPYRPDDLPGARARRGEVVQGEELLVRVREPFHEVPILMSAVALRAADGNILGTLSVFQDITPRKQLDRERAAEQQELRDSETRLRATVEVALDALISMDTAGRISDWNPSAEAMFGWRRDEIMGQEMAATVVPERYRAPHRSGLRRFLETGQGRVIGRRIEIEALHRDGHEFPIELAISAIQTSGGLSFTAFVRDISARRRLEAAQAAALAQVQASLRLRDDFLSAAAHDLKTPLTSVKGHLQLVRRRLGDSVAPGVAASLDQVEHSTARMTDLINELLDVARLQSGQTLSLNRREMDLVALARTVADAAARQAPRHSIEVVAEVPTLIGIWDRARIERALTNLMSNAVKYSPGSGEIVLTARRERDGQAEWAVLSVRDQGVGIPASDLPRLFTRFHRGANATRVEGTGIGLEATRRMIELHDGTISVESTEGAGSTFTVRLPLGQPE